MPYRWTKNTHPGGKDPKAHLVLWPHQSMTAKGFAAFIGITAVLLLSPILAMLGSAESWVMLIFFGGALAAIWFAINANKRRQQMREDLFIWSDLVRLEHVVPNQPMRMWEANPYWISVHLRDDGPVKKYLTLKGNEREVELGAFLTPEEREELYTEIQALLRDQH